MDLPGICNQKLNSTILIKYNQNLQQKKINIEKIPAQQKKLNKFKYAGKVFKFFFHFSKALIKTKLTY